MKTSVTTAKAIAAEFSRELGFVNRAALEVSHDKGELEIVGDGAGFVHWHARRDGQITIYSLAVSKRCQGEGWGRLLLYRVLCRAVELGKRVIVAKCPEDLPSNGFYRANGFVLADVESGRKRRLNRWELAVQTPFLFYVGSGGASRYDAAAAAAGWRIGVRSCGKYLPRSHMAMIDNHWQRYDHDRHLAMVREHKPMVATVCDVERAEQFKTALEQSAELQRYCGRVLIIPKHSNCPRPSHPFWWGFSVPTAYGGTPLPPSWFGRDPVHLLGGSPKKQAQYAGVLNVVSLDGNYASKVAGFGKVSTPWGDRIPNPHTVPHGEGYPYRCLAASLIEQQRHWHCNRNHQLTLF